MGNELRFFLMNFLLQRILAHLVQIILWIEGVPRVFGSVSQSRIWLDNHGGYSSRIKSLMIQMVESRTNLITF